VLKAAADNLKKLMKQMPNNAAKRQPLQDAINTAEATIQKYGGLGDE
jgi:cytochrome c-type biogenesis protein CcmH/NrfG